MAHLLYALLWVSFCIPHSFLAEPEVKARLASFAGARYRLYYNVLAVFHLVVVLALGKWLYRDAGGFDISLVLQVVLTIFLIAGVVLMYVALKQYNLGLFSGLAQIRDADSADGSEELTTSGIHQYVRHPLYSAAFLLLWGIASTPFGLATAIFGSLYLVVGTWFEEKKLVGLYGDTYRQYQKQVPAFIPWRGMRVSAD